VRPGFGTSPNLEAHGNPYLEAFFERPDNPLIGNDSQQNRIPGPLNVTSSPRRVTDDNGSQLGAVVVASEIEMRLKIMILPDFRKSSYFCSACVVGGIMVWLNRFA
jgi:hypothetical protein